MRIEDRKIVQSFELSLRKEKGLRNNWLTILIYTILILLLPTTVLILFNVTFEPQLEGIIHNTNAAISTVAVNFAYATFGVVTAPYLFLAGTWVAQINNIHKSKYFHIGVWLNNFLTLILGLTGLVIIFCSFVVWF